MYPHFTKNSLSKGKPSKLFSLSLTALAITLGAISLSCIPAYAQGNTDLEVFAGGVARSNPQGFNVGHGYSGIPGAGAVNIKRDALQQVTWFKSRRQVSIEDDSPIVTNRCTNGPVNGALGGQAGLTPATFGGSGAMAGAIGAPRNLSPAQFGPFARPEQAHARPIMHSWQGSLQGKPALSNAPIADGLSNARRQTAATPASYSSYGGPQAVSSASDSAGARIREVKARLLGGQG